MKNLILTLTLLVSFGNYAQELDFADFSVSSKYYTASDEELAIMTDSATLFFNNTSEEKKRWATETKKHTRIYILNNGYNENLIIKKQLEINSEEFRTMISSKDNGFLNTWNKMIYKTDEANADGSGPLAISLGLEIIKSDFGTFNNKYNYLYTIIKSGDETQSFFQNAIWITVDSMIYTINITSSTLIYLEDVIISINSK
tara:strand:- start:1021 stop:1623 length:603 start_codon:yes stop_codon:yes gene_type:complete